jgi:hypothetical protein
MLCKAWATGWMDAVFADIWIQVQTKSRIVMAVILITFIVAVASLILAIISYTKSDTNTEYQNSHVVLIPKNYVVHINNQEYIPVKLLK